MSVVAVVLFALSTVSCSSAPLVVASSVHMSGLLPHGPISIDNEADFTSQGWPGSGTPGNPFRIENLNITCSQVCISVHNVATCFVISGCFLQLTQGRRHVLH